MYQDASTTLQAVLDKFPRPRKLTQQILILDVIHLDTTMLKSFPVFKVFKIIAED